MAPTVMRSGPYRLFFYASDRGEPHHIHVERNEKLAKFWLDPIRLQSSGGFSRLELRRIRSIISESIKGLTEHGMAILAVELQVPDAVDVQVTEDTLSVELSDGRTISVPLGWYLRLEHASANERANWRLIGKGCGIHWEDIDEDLSIEGLLAGKTSGESQASFKRWLQSRRS